MGGWFRKEIKSPVDHEGPEVPASPASPAWSAPSWASIPQQIAGGDIYPALEKGTIDAAEWVGPVRRTRSSASTRSRRTTTIRVGGKVARSLGLHQPRQVERAAQGLQAVIERLRRAQDWMSPSTTRRIPRRCASWWPAGTKLMPFPQPVMEAASPPQRALRRDLGEEPEVQEGLRNWRPFRNEEILWFRVCECTFDNFMARMSAANKLG
jgi:TRAP-type mannitol/chloroaromatic compound transport system substrate-binding protein